MSPRPSTDGSNSISLGCPEGDSSLGRNPEVCKEVEQANYYGREAAARERRVEPKSAVRGGTELRLTLTEQEF